MCCSLALACVTSNSGRVTHAISPTRIPLRNERHEVDPGLLWPSLYYCFQRHEANHNHFVLQVRDLCSGVETLPWIRSCSICLYVAEGGTDFLGVHYSRTSRDCHARAEHIFTPFCVPGSLPPFFTNMLDTRPIC